MSAAPGRAIGVDQDVPGILLVGGASEIGLAIVRNLLGDGTGRVVLAGRPSHRLDVARDGLALLGHDVTCLPYTVGEPTGQVQRLLRDTARHCGVVDVVVIAVGTLDAGEHAGVEALLETNVVGPATVAEAAVEALCAQGHGRLVVLTSVAAALPRDEILAYSAAKQALDTYVRGLDRAARSRGVRCMVVRPGRVRTRMIDGLPPAPLTRDPDDVARSVRRALRTGRRVVWVPAVLGPVAAVLRLVPTSLRPRRLR
ncbi:SDR family NAD(P)-dependent oxidoreductase [Kineosporia sp. A_224]|uniref:SDR family NAD(P)-dependent oxidoreductase n=1 Tax=Kineosporia sp. A_224 TaxID=1962180 RepID=UPI0013045020|nr:SDR family NAD(P)-dependent oxidoreductase [Kineosporia sp. A_224]